MSAPIPRSIAATTAATTAAAAAATTTTILGGSPLLYPRWEMAIDTSIYVYILVFEKVRCLNIEHGGQPGQKVLQVRCPTRTHASTRACTHGMQAGRQARGYACGHTGMDVRMGRDVAATAECRWSIVRGHSSVRACHLLYSTTYRQP